VGVSKRGITLDPPQIYEREADQLTEQTTIGSGEHEKELKPTIKALSCEKVAPETSFRKTRKYHSRPTETLEKKNERQQWDVVLRWEKKNCDPKTNKIMGGGGG